MKTLWQEFLQGLSSAFDFGPDAYARPDFLASPKSDMEALVGDWEALCKDGARPLAHGVRSIMSEDPRDLPKDSPIHNDKAPGIRRGLLFRQRKTFSRWRGMCYNGNIIHGDQS